MPVLPNGNIVPTPGFEIVRIPTGFANRPRFGGYLNRYLPMNSAYGQVTVPDPDYIA